MTRFGLLGAVAVERGGELTSVRWPMPRSVLAALLLSANRGTDPGPDLRNLHQQILAGSVRLVTAPRWQGAVRPAQLPADLEDFTGRARDVRLLTELAGSAGSQPGIVPVCVVTGPAGIGKTSLAVHVSHQLRDRFPDGQLYAQLGAGGDRPAGSGQVLGAFLRSLGIAPGKIPAGEPERAAVFRTMLVGRRVLIVLDDAGGTPARYVLAARDGRMRHASDQPESAYRPAGGAQDTARRIHRW